MAAESVFVGLPAGSEPEALENRVNLQKISRQITLPGDFIFAISGAFESVPFLSASFRYEKT